MNSRIIVNGSTTFASREAAQAVAAVNNADADGWKYSVAMFGANRYVIEIHDETGVYVGCL